LNSGIFVSSSLVALNSAWSGYQGLGLDGVAADAPVVAVEPVVVVEDGRPAPGGMVFAAPV
jgi:hypothetical protein